MVANKKCKPFHRFKMYNKHKTLVIIYLMGGINSILRITYLTFGNTHIYKI